MRSRHPFFPSIFRWLMPPALSLCSSSVWGAVFLAPGADPEGFQKYLQQSRQVSYTQEYLETLRKAVPEAHAEVLDFSQKALKEGKTESLLGDWQTLRKHVDLNSADREVLALLAEKLQITKELCRYLLLDEDLLGLLEAPATKLQECGKEALPLPQALREQAVRRGELWLIDGKVFLPERLPKALIPGAYHWRLISNQNQDEVFWGSAYEFSKRGSGQTPWVQGSCQSYQWTHPDFTVSAQAMIYFNSSCVVPALPPERGVADWVREHPTLVWGLGVLSAGVLAFQLKDKTLVITKSY